MASKGNPSPVTAIGIDLGASAVRVCLPGKSPDIDEPSLFALSKRREILAHGDAAEALLLRAPESAEEYRPLLGKERLTKGEDGKIDVSGRVEALKLLIGAFSPELCAAAEEYSAAAVICTEDGASAKEIGILTAEAEKYGIPAVRTVRRSDANAAAVMHEARTRRGKAPSDFILVDIGLENTNVSLICGGKVRTSGQIPVGGIDFDERIAELLAEKHGMAADVERIDRLKRELSGSDSAELLCYGAENAIPDTVTVTGGELAGIFGNEIERICSGLVSLLRHLPKEQASGVLRGGIVLVGGGSLFPGLAEEIESTTGIGTTVPECAAFAAASGAALAVNG